MESSCLEYETRSVTLNWTISNLKQLFDASKGETKSRCVKSSLFDSERWQIFFYPNSGHESYCSLYLSCEPSEEEKLKGAEDKRRGGIEPIKGTLNTKDSKLPWKREGKFKFTFEAKSLDKRNTFKSMEATNHSFSDTARNWGYQNFWKRSEAYYSNSTIKEADAMLIICTIVYSTTPPSAAPLPRLLIPKSLVLSYASLFDDPDYSDVVFRIKAPGKKERLLFAAKKILARSQYFDTMFSSGFNESHPTLPSSIPDQDEEEDPDDGLDEDDDSDLEGEQSDEEFDEVEEILITQKASAGSEDSHVRASDEEDEELSTAGDTSDIQIKVNEESKMEFVDAQSVVKKTRGMDGRPRFEVIVTDASYSTFRALLYYLYTDSCHFAPLSSTYQAALEAATLNNTPFNHTRASYVEAAYPSTVPISACSSKAIYRLSDKIGLNELKERAFQFIISSLTVQNIPYEVFGSFAVRFDEVRRVEIAFLLEKWNEVRTSASMKKVFNNIRSNRYPGFENVWATILENLEYRSEKEEK